MTGCAPKWRLFLFLFLSFHLAGCTQMRRGSLDEEKEPHFIDGRSRAGRYDWDGAILSFERAVQVNPDNASAHLELGVLYDTRKRDFISALYHYNRHLLLRTNSPLAAVVQDKMKGCTRELSKTVQFAVLTREVQRDLERYEQTNSLNKKRIEQLEAELTRRPQYLTNYVTNFVGVPQLDGRGSSRMTQPTRPLEIDEVPAESPVSTQRVEQRRPVNSVPVAQKNTPGARRETQPRVAQPVPINNAAKVSHTVRPGETLASLAARYGVSVQTLRSANPGAANGVHAGQRLSIPK